MNCKQVRRKIGSFLDNEVSGKEYGCIEEHLGRCQDCRSEEMRLQELSSLIKTLPEIIPDAQSEARFWEHVEKQGKPALWEKVRTISGQWEIMPLRYPSTVMILLGLAVGLLLNTMYVSDGRFPQEVRPAAVEYFALSRMASVPEGSVTGVYLSMADTMQNGEIQ
jgi:hypothetical protein